MKFRSTTMAGFVMFAGLGAALLLAAFTPEKKQVPTATVACATPEKACIFKTVLGLESYDTALVIHNRALVESSISKGMQWMAQAQAPNGGWGAGSHSRQDVPQWIFSKHRNV